MVRPRSVVLLAAVPAVAAAVRHLRGHASAHGAAGGAVIGQPGVYGAVTRWALGGLYRGVAADVAAQVDRGASVLEVGCGPGHLAVRLANQHGLDVTALDLDAAMVARARGHADRASWPGDARPPAFSVGDAAALPFPDDSFDVVVSTLSVHHWAEPAAGLAEIGRVLRPDGRALIWDLRPGSRVHPHVPDPAELVAGSPLQVTSATPWSWPWRFHPTQRIELVVTAPSAPA